MAWPAVLDSSHHWGFVDTTYLLKIPCRFGYITNPSFATWQEAPGFLGSNCLVRYESKYCVINTKGEIYSPLSDCFFDIDTSQNFFALICCSDGKFGLLNSRIDLVVPCLYDELFMSPFEKTWGEAGTGLFYVDGGDLIPAKLNGKLAYIDRNGVVKIPFVYEQISHFESGKAKVKLNDIEFFIDEKGNRIP